MLFRPDRPERLALIADQLRSTDRLSPDLVSSIASEISHGSANGSASPSIAKLIAAGAWTDTALALIASELPQWKLRRLAYDDGEWHCVLSLQREFPNGSTTELKPVMRIFRWHSLRDSSKQRGYAQRKNSYRPYRASGSGSPRRPAATTSHKRHQSRSRSSVV